MITWNKCKKITKEQRLARRGLAFSPSAHATPEGFKRRQLVYRASSLWPHRHRCFLRQQNERQEKSFQWLDLVRFTFSFVKMSSLRSLQLSPRIFTLRRQHTELSSTHLRHRQTHCSKSAESAESQVTWWRIRGILRMHLSLSNEILSNCYDTTYSHRGKRVYIWLIDLIVIAGYWKNHLARSNPITIWDLASLHPKGTWWPAPQKCPASPDQARGSKWSEPKWVPKKCLSNLQQKKQSSSFTGKRFKNSPKCFRGAFWVGKTLSFLSWKKRIFFFGEGQGWVVQVCPYLPCIVHCSLIWSWHLANRLTGFPSMCSS